MTIENKMFEALLEDTHHEISILANTSAFLNEMLPTINWVGFYLNIEDKLILGPFQGKSACVEIEIGQGVCGHVAQTLMPIIVDDVHQFEGHIACDSQSQSEMVLPILIGDTLYGVLDIDAPIKKRFTQADLDFCESVIDILVKKLKQTSSHRT